MRLWSLLVALAVAPACRAESFHLGDVPIEGGTAEQRRAARAELDRLADAFTTPPELSLVRFDEVDGFYGAYRHRDRRVRVDLSVEPESVAGVVRHEACHALYEQISTLELDSADAERVVDDAADIDDYGGRRRTQSEVYAIVCGWGEDGLAAAHTACGPEERPGGMHYWRVLSRQSSGAGWRFGRCLEQGESAAIGIVSDDGVWLGLSGAGAEATVLGLE